MLIHNIGPAVACAWLLIRDSSVQKNKEELRHLQISIMDKSTSLWSITRTGRNLTVCKENQRLLQTRWSHEMTLNTSWSIVLSICRWLACKYILQLTKKCSFIKCTPHTAHCTFQMAHMHCMFVHRVLGLRPIVDSQTVKVKLHQLMGSSLVWSELPYDRN